MNKIFFSNSESKSTLKDGKSMKTSGKNFSWEKLLKYVGNLG